MNQLRSEEYVLESPLSFTGSAKRIWKLTELDQTVVRWLVLIPLALFLITFAWIFILFWYVWFGIFIFPYRIFRRSRRRQELDRLRHEEMLAALQAQQRQ